MRQSFLVLLNWLDRCIGLYFAGTYFYSLDKSNGGNLECSTHFAIQSIFIIVLANLLFAAGIAFTFFGLDTLLQSKLTNVSILIGLFSLCWIYFVWQDRYKAFVRDGKDEQDKAKRIGMGVNWTMFAAFFAMIIRLIIIM